MASYTTNLNLKKPAGSENVSIGDINNNMDLIDQAYGEMKDFIKTKALSASDSPFTINIPENSRHAFIMCGSSGDTRSAMYIVRCTANGSMSFATVFQGSLITSVDTSVSGKMTITYSGSSGMNLIDLVISGSAASVSE